METENLKIGARGWLHQHWVGSYYPDDLPEDWRLSYYANEFGVVLVPAGYWGVSKGYDLKQWLDEVDEEFRFYLEYPSLKGETEVNHFNHQCALMEHRLGGVVVDGDVDITRIEAHCPVVQKPALQDKGLCVGFIEEDFEDLRKVRAWLESFDKRSEGQSKVVFITNRGECDIQMETLSKIHTLSEMMGL